MPHQIHLHHHLVHVEYLGIVTPLDVFDVIKDEGFKQAYNTHKQVIYDFSSADGIDFVVEDLIQFAKLGDLEANFNEQVHLVIILFEKSNASRAEYYRERLRAPFWRVDIVETYEEAMGLFDHR